MFAIFLIPYGEGSYLVAKIAANNQSSGFLQKYGVFKTQNFHEHLHFIKTTVFNRIVSGQNWFWLPLMEPHGRWLDGQAGEDIFASYIGPCRGRSGGGGRGCPRWMGDLGRAGCAVG